MCWCKDKRTPKRPHFEVTCTDNSQKLKKVHLSVGVGTGKYPANISSSSGKLILCNNERTYAYDEASGQMNTEHTPISR